ncbi:MAG TPA: outer membrane lipoprotein-sorting protein [Gammaproteobacteria bacterium]|nr:outer membrane lipoprotein-sorting protein [Gammaproteobacteria bacterium]
MPPIQRKPWFYSILIATALMCSGTALATPGAEDIVRQCGNKIPGQDLKTKLTIELINKAGDTKRQEFVRHWKDSGGQDDIMSKTLLVTTYPPDSKGVAFLRWTYSPEVNKHDAQWLYLPKTKTLRKIPIQDLNNNFLNSDLTYGDMAPRAVSDDTHTLVDEDADFYVVESRPREKDTIYSKKRVWYKKRKNGDECVKSRVEYYDLSGALLKTQTIRWENMGGAWIWREMQVKNVQNGHSTRFTIDDVQLNTGLKDNLFTTRTLKRGLTDL